MNKYFNSNETLEMCDVRISENGKVEVLTKSYHSEELARLGRPEKTIRGRMTMDTAGNLAFDPYAEASRRPTYMKKAVVGATTLAVTANCLKLSLVLTRNYTKEMLTALIEAEITEVVRRLREDLYESLIGTQKGGDA